MPRVILCGVLLSSHTDVRLIALVGIFAPTGSKERLRTNEMPVAVRSSLLCGHRTGKRGYLAPGMTFLRLEMMSLSCAWPVRGMDLFPPLALPHSAIIAGQSFTGNSGADSLVVCASRLPQFQSLIRPLNGQRPKDTRRQAQSGGGSAGARAGSGPAGRTAGILEVQAPLRALWDDGVWYNASIVTFSPEDGNESVIPYPGGFTSKIPDARPAGSLPALAPAPPPPLLVHLSLPFRRCPLSGGMGLWR